MLISRKKLEHIANNLIITEHSLKRIQERLGKNINIKNIILDSPFWFRNVDKTINIAIDQKRYFVVVEEDNKFTLITFKDESYNNYDIMDKFVIAYNGIERKEIK